MLLCTYDLETSVEFWRMSAKWPYSGFQLRIALCRRILGFVLSSPLYRIRRSTLLDLRGVQRLV